MKASDHPDYPVERSRLQVTLEALAAHLDELANTRPVTAYEDAAEALLLHFRAEYRALSSASQSPYFARIDFIPVDAERTATHYIGRKGFNHAGAAVVDWRAPLAALFYRGKPGAVDYASPGGRVRGLMRLKRNLDVRERELVAIADDFDIRETWPGEAIAAFVEPGAYLRDRLAERRDPYLQDIIATIQEQQYALIQADVNQVIIVQGVAGSGKTSIALHRLAYLLHPGNADNIDPQRCIVFGPNRLFLSFIGLVLPELDIERATHTTLAEWACDQLGLDASRVVDPALDAILDPNTPRDARARHYRRSRLRSSSSMGRLLERYIEHRRQPALPDTGLDFPEAGPLKVTARLTRERIAELHAQHAALPLSQHRQRFIETMKAELNHSYEDAIARRLDKMSAEGQQLAGQASQLREESRQLQRLSILARSLDDARLQERNAPEAIEQGANGLIELARHFERQAEAARARVDRVREDVRETRAWRHAVDQLAARLEEEVDQRWPALEAARDYYALIADRPLLAELAKGLFAPEEIELLAGSPPPADGAIDANDLPALHFLHALAEGVVPRFDHIVIDEAQDVSRLQLETVGRFSRNGSLTILGDLPQSIYAHRGLASWDEARAAFADRDLSYHEITISYRTTFEIATLANSVLRMLSVPGGPVLATPFERHARPPQWRRLADASQLAPAIADGVLELRRQGYLNIAIIAKTADDAVGLAVPLYDHVEAFELIETAEAAYRGGLVILPVHLAKGMEFEAAIVAGADAAHYPATELDGRLLYVAVTRALHALHVYWAGEVSPYLEGALSEGERA